MLLDMLKKEMNRVVEHSATKIQRAYAKRVSKRAREAFDMLSKGASDEAAYKHFLGV